MTCARLLTSTAFRPVQRKGVRSVRSPSLWVGMASQLKIFVCRKREERWKCEDICGKGNMNNEKESWIATSYMTPDTTNGENHPLGDNSVCVGGGYQGGELTRYFIRLLRRINLVPS